VNDSTDAEAAEASQLASTLAAQALRARNALDAMEALDENVSDMLGCLMSPNVRVRPFKLRLNCESTDPSATALTGADVLRTGQHALR
jgi:hypothetical protein